jgi:uncharacterized protein (TIGR00369 family)
MTTGRREIVWHDPAHLAGAAASRAGLDVLREMASGQLPMPPIAATLGMEAVSADPGVAVFALEPDASLYNPIGVVHGGVAATLLDSAMGCAVHTTLSAQEAYTTLEIKVNFVRALTLATGRVRAEGRVVTRGRRVATAEGRLVAEKDDRLLAHATTTCLLLTTSDGH